MNPQENFPFSLHETSIILPNMNDVPVEKKPSLVLLNNGMLRNALSSTEVLNAKNNAYFDWFDFKFRTYLEELFMLSLDTSFSTRQPITITAISVNKIVHRIKNDTMHGETLVLSNFNAMSLLPNFEFVKIRSSRGFRLIDIIRTNFSLTIKKFSDAGYILEIENITTGINNQPVVGLLRITNFLNDVQRANLPLLMTKQPLNEENITDIGDRIICICTHL